MGKSISDLLKKKTNLPITTEGNRMVISIPDPEPMLRELKDEIDKLTAKVAEVDSKEIPVPKDYTPELNSLNKELDTIKGNIRSAVTKLSFKIDDINSKPSPPPAKEYSSELGELNTQLDRVKDSIKAIEDEEDSTEPLKEDIKKIKVSIEDLYKSINNVISAVNNLPRGKGSTYVLEGGNGGSSTAYVLKTDYADKGYLLAGLESGEAGVLLPSGTTGYVLSADSTETTGLKWVTTPSGTPSGTAVALTAYGASSAAGTSAEYSRGDHSHGSVADLVTGTAHATLGTGVHGAGTATIATTSDITTALTTTVLKAAFTAKGSLLAGSAASSPTSLAIAGTTGYVLSVDSGETTGMKWIASPAGTPSGTAIALTAYGASSAAGTSSEYSRGDHSHGSVADIVSGTAHATLATGVHGAGTATIATTSDITTHAGLTGTHGAGTIASIAAVTAQITTHAGSTDPHNVYTLKTAWTAITGSPQNPNSDSKLYAWWGRYSSGTTEPTVTRTNGSCICADVIAYRGCNSAATPINNQAAGTAAASTALSFATGISTTKNNCMIVLFSSSGADSNLGQLASQANANLSSITERVDDCTNLGPGGGVEATEGFLASSGAIGTWTGTYGTATGQGRICIALEPPAGWANIGKVNTVSAANINKIGTAGTSTIAKISGKAV